MGEAVGVVGAGVMGVGIAQRLAQAGHQVVVVDPSPAALASGPARLRDGVRLAALVRGKGAGAVRPETALDRVVWTASTEELGTAGFVVECTPERTSVKDEVFRTLDRVCPSTAVLASNTSAIPVDWLAGRTERPELVLGTHFMNPAPVRDVVEVVCGARTSELTLDRTHALLSTMGMHGIVVADAPGFVSNRVLMLTINEAASVVRAGTAEASTVDLIFRECFGHPIGPLHTADLIGVDVIVDTLRVLIEFTGDDRFIPCALLLAMVERGHTGRKTGRGFYQY